MHATGSFGLIGRKCAEEEVRCAMDATGINRLMGRKYYVGEQKFAVDATRGFR